MTEMLFHTNDLRRTIEAQGRGLANEVDSMSENEVLTTSPEDMVKYLAEKWRINPLAIDESGIHMDYGDAQIDVSGDILRGIFCSSRPFYITGTRVTFYVPFTGDSNLFRCQPSTYSLSPPRATITRDSPDQTNFPGNSSFWDTVKYNPAFQGRQMRPDSLKFPVFI